jgi:hypothetical protein
MRLEIDREGAELVLDRTPYDGLGFMKPDGVDEGENSERSATPMRGY